MASIFARFRKSTTGSQPNSSIMGHTPKKRRPIWIVLFAVVLLASIGVGVYYFVQYRRVVQNPDLVSKQELTSILEKVNKLMDLPQDETPTLATVLNKDNLKDQDFFKKAENGDKVLVYTNNKKAILYRPNTNKIIEVMPVYNDETEKAAATGAITANPKVALYNGTGKAGLTNTAETKIKDKVANIEIALKENASKTNYTKTIVVDISGKMADQAKKIAEAVGGEVSSLPDGEKKPNADILVIVAK